MASSDQSVGAKLILRAQLEVRRRGAADVTRELEQAEPDLAELLIEGLSDLHRRLLALRGSPRSTERTYARTQALLLTTVVALRTAHAELWAGQHQDDDPDEKDDGDPPPT